MRKPGDMLTVCHEPSKQEEIQSRLERRLFDERLAELGYFLSEEDADQAYQSFLALGKVVLPVVTGLSNGN